MDNAIQDVKRIADRVIESNDNEGIASYLLEMFI